MVAFLAGGRAMFPPVPIAIIFLPSGECACIVCPRRVCYKRLRYRLASAALLPGGLAELGE